MGGGISDIDTILYFYNGSGARMAINCDKKENILSNIDSPDIFDKDGYDININFTTSGSISKKFVSADNCELDVVDITTNTKLEKTLDGYKYVFKPNTSESLLLITNKWNNKVYKVRFYSF